VFSAHFDNVDEETLRKDTGGRTLMVQDLRNKWTLEDVLGLFDELGAECVDYVFLPFSVWETKKSMSDPQASKLGKGKTRNKSYCFVHFSDAAASDAFVDRLSRYRPPIEGRSDGAEVRVRQMHTSPASTQGIVQNLLRLMDVHSRKWHPRAGALALRLGDSLVSVNVGALRKFIVDLLHDDPTKAPGCLRKDCTFSFFFGPSTFLLNDKKEGKRLNTQRNLLPQGPSPLPSASGAA